MPDSELWIHRGWPSNSAAGHPLLGKVGGWVETPHQRFWGRDKQALADHKGPGQANLPLRGTCSSSEINKEPHK